MSQAIDDILDDVLMGMYVRRPSDNGMDFDFVPLDDRHGVLREDARKQLSDLVDQIITGEKGELISYTDKQDTFAHGYITAQEKARAKAKSLGLEVGGK